MRPCLKHLQWSPGDKQTLRHVRDWLLLNFHHNPFFQYSHVDGSSGVKGKQNDDLIVVVMHNVRKVDDKVRCQLYEKYCLEVYACIKKVAGVALSTQSL